METCLSVHTSEGVVTSSILKLHQTDINLSTKLRDLGAVFDEILTLKYQVSAVKKEGYWRSYKHCKNIEVY